VSIRIDATGDILERTATVPSFGSFTLTLWLYRAVAHATEPETAFGIVDNTSGDCLAIFCDGDTDVLGINESTGWHTGTGSTFTPGTWKRAALVFDNIAATVTLYEGGDDETVDLTQTLQLPVASVFTVTHVMANFQSITGGVLFSGRFANIKLYTAVLSAARCKEELAYFNIQDAANIWGAWTCKTDTTTITDASGNNRPLTGTGLTTEADPPIDDEPGGALALEQYAYRFRNDDGSETTATWKAAQNTSASITPDETFRFRVGVNATADPPSHQYKVQYRKVGAAEWRDIDTAG
jgi:hypothetical protein